MADPRGEIFDDVVVRDKKTLLRYLRLQGTRVLVSAKLCGDYTIVAELSVEQMEREMARIEVTEECAYGTNITYYAVWHPADQTLELGTTAVADHEDVLRHVSARLRKERGS
jgi:hypothetical protein